MTTNKKEKKRISKSAMYVTESRNWYKDQYRKTMSVLLIVICLLTGSLIANVIQLLTKTKPVYFAATPDLQIAEMIPLNQPYLTQAGLLDWAAETIVQALSIDFLKWRKQLTRARINFSSDAFKQVVLSLKDSGILPMIRSQRLNVHVVLTSTPVITASGLYQGKYSWRVEVPVLLSYEASTGIVNTQKLIAKMMIQRANTNVHIKGVYITQLILKNA